MCNRFSKNLGLGEGSALPVGVPIPWPSATPPTGWLKCNGAAFTALQYPKLALAYPALRLPDLRGEFIRGWDDGRGIDSGRSLLSAQSDAIRNITGTVFGRCDRTGMKVFSNGSGAFVATKTGDPYGAVNSAYVVSTDLDDRWSQLVLDVSRSVPVAADNRPRNIAFNYIVRAA
ncbi:phage tail protein [Salmonella enterica subsp. enterica]|nr:phage tail protein [Salmonella enterica subsp. enterica serovar Hartford]